MPELTLRPATAGDIPAVLAFWQAAAENADRPADTAEAVAALIARDPGALLLALLPAPAPAPEPAPEPEPEPVPAPELADAAEDVAVDAVVVGTVIAGWDGWRCHLYRLAVSPDHRRRGIGQALIAAAEQRFRAFGGIRVDAMVLDDNAQAHRIWQAAGYTAQARWSRWIKPLPEPD